jgi:hypothetical protein
VNDNEAILHEQVCSYLKLQYPSVLFRTDMGGVRLMPGQARKQARLQAGRSWPDIMVAEPRKGYHGMFLELKREGTTIWLRDGSLTINKHIREQMDLLILLAAKGYNAQMVVGFESAKRAIDHYLEERQTWPKASDGI